MTITPSVGRVVWYYPGGKEGKSRGDQPYAGLVAYVHSDICVNLGGYDHNGKHFEATSVTLRQPQDLEPEVGSFCEWMPYQIGQAAKHEPAPMIEGVQAGPAQDVNPASQPPTDAGSGEAA